MQFAKICRTELAGMMAMTLKKTLFKCICIFSKVPFAPEVDLLFAVSATTRNASETLRTMKDILIYIINTYGVGNIRYVFVSFLCSTYEDMRHRPFTRFS